MHTTDYYLNRDLDAKIMSARLEWGREITTKQAIERVAELKERRADYIRNYKSVEQLERTIGYYQLLILDRQRWSSYCCDDCSHWAGLQ